jgi:hypothetical protein
LTFTAVVNIRDLKFDIQIAVLVCRAVAQLIRVIPAQVVIYSPKGTNNTIELLFGTQMPPRGDIALKDDLRLFSPAAALIRVPDAFFTRYPIEAQLSGIKDTSEILSRLLDGGHSAIAGRLAGALRRVGRADGADDILKAMKDAGYDVREADPFAPAQVFGAFDPGVAPIVGRVRALWQSMRGPVVDSFSKPPGLPKDKTGYLKFVEDIYQNDAYHSLSIEGYSVTPELIDRVRSGNWNPKENEEDRKNRDALAARGYFHAFQAVKKSVSEIIAGGDPGEIVRTAHREWYRELFQPSIAAAILRAGALAGYRQQTGRAGSLCRTP